MIDDIISAKNRKLYLVALDVSLLHELKNRQRFVRMLRPYTTGDKRVVRHQPWEYTGLVHLLKNFDGLLRGMERTACSRQEKQQQKEDDSSQQQRRAQAR